MVKVEEEMVKVEEEASTTFKRMFVKHLHNQSVKFVSEVVMMRKIVGSRANLNVSIARNLGIFKRIVDSTTINKQTLPKSKKAKKACSMLVNPHPSTRMMYGSLIVDVAIT